MSQQDKSQATSDGAQAQIESCRNEFNRALEKGDVMDIAVTIYALELALGHELRLYHFGPDMCRATMAANAGLAGLRVIDGEVA